MNEGKTKAEIAERLSMSRITLWRDLAALRERYKSENSEEFEAYRKAQLAILERIEQSIVEGIVSPDVANAWRQVRADIARLLGLDAPSRSLSVRVRGDDSPQFLRFKKATAGLDEIQVEEALALIARMPRRASAAVVDASWFPPPEAEALADGDGSAADAPQSVGDD